MFHSVGENPEKLSKWHRSTIDRTKAFAIAIHIPVLLWALTGYVIASSIFNLGVTASIAVATFCSVLIYMIERIVLATPKNWYVNVMRLLIGIVIAILGASTFDLVIFDKEVRYQLKKTEELRVNDNFDRQIANKSQILLIKKNDWLKAQDAANCEANGECGSKTKSLGPIYKALKDHANDLKQEYVQAQLELERLLIDKNQNLDIADKRIVSESGLLARIEALHQYTLENRAALVGWGLFFSLILFFELMVVLSKLVFGETVDDRIETIRGVIIENKVKSYQDTITSPLFAATKLIQSVY
jgi:hypothetical protein